MAKTPEETAEWLHRITLEGYGDGFMEAADVIRSLQSKLGTAEEDLKIMDEAVRQQIEEYRAEVENSGRKDALIQDLQSRLSACELERDEHRKALGRLSAFLHNPALEVPGDKSFSDALVEYALAEIKGRADRLQDELKQNDILQREIDTIKAVAEGEIKALSSRLDEVSKQADRYVEEERREGERRLHELTAVLRAERDMWRKQHDHLAEQITKGVLLRPAPPILIDNLDRVRELESRLGSVRKLLEIDVDDDRRWDEMAKLFPGVEVKAGVVERQTPKREPTDFEDFVDKIKGREL